MVDYILKPLILCCNFIAVILVLIRFVKAKVFRTSYTVQKTKNIFAKIFSVGINENSTFRKVMETKIYATLFLLFLYNFSFAQNDKRSYTASRTTITPKIDGVLNDDAWNTIPVATGMLQLRPTQGKAATHEIDLKLIYDDDAVYVSAMLYDSAPDSIMHALGSRDGESILADAFYIGFDTYNRLDAYVFGITASGVQMETKDSDPTYDAVWESAVKINDKGWTVEMRIPYSAIRFPSTAEQEWGFQFTREIKRSGEYVQWALTPPTLSNSRLAWGTLKGISNIKAPLRLSLTPFVTAFAENAPAYTTGESVVYDKSTSYNVGADLKYGLNEKFTLDLTLLPDFSQVQSDNKVKSLSYSEVTYNENRPFFKEGTELFTKDNLFYSRRIGKIPFGYYYVPYMLGEGETIRENPSKTRLLNAVKFSGRNNKGLGIGLFNAITDNAYAVVEDSLGNSRKILTEPLTNYNAVVFDQKFKNTSSVYLVNTNTTRNNKNYYNANVTDAGFSIKNKKATISFDGFGTVSQKLQKFDSLKDNADDRGYQYFLGCQKISGNLQYGYSHMFISKSYDSRDMGYYIIGNKMRERVYVSYNTFKPNKYFRESYNSASFDYGINPETKKKYVSQGEISFYFVMNNYANLSFSAMATPFVTYDYNEPRVEGRYSRNPRYYYTSAGYSSNPRKAIIYGLNLQFGDFLERYEGKGYMFNPNLTYRINDKLQVGYSFTYNVDSYNIGFADITDDNTIIYGGRKLITYENDFGLQYMFKNDMSLSLSTRHYWNTGEYLKYYTLLDNGEVEDNTTYDKNNNFSYNVFNVDLVYSWQFAPGSTLSLAYKNAIETEEGVLVRSYFDDINKTIEAPQTNSISLKVLYYLDHHSVKKMLKKRKE